VADVLVIGGGIIGAALAAQCARRGMTVTLCERDRLASAASGRNAGFVVGPHPPALATIAERSLREYRELHFATGGAFAYDRDSIGSIVVAEAAADLAGAPGEVLDGAAVRELEPELADDLAGGYLIEARRIDPAAATLAWADEARSYGAEIHVACEARGLLRRAGAVVGAITDQGQLLARTTVVAAGPWSWQLTRGTGFDVPVRGVRGFVAVTRPAAFRLRHLIEDAAWDPGSLPPVTVRTLADGDARPSAFATGLGQDDDGRIVIGASHTRAGEDDEVARDTLAEVCRRAIRFVPALAELEVVATRSCLRPMTPDGLPLHGPVPGEEGLVLCCGHNAQGIAWGPGAAAVVAESLESGQWDTALSPERFAAVAT
jgi:glycine/D-amino acid oxidase-like deaminating enzyme